MTGAIFISYRRSDAAGHAGRLYDRLKDHFGADRIFMDVDTLQPGVDFVDRIDEALGSCGALLAIIGHRWSQAEAPDGRRRLEDPDDFVGLEVGAALRRKIPVIPVLVQRATMPDNDELPEALKPLRRRHAIELDDTRWNYDVGRLIQVLENTLAEDSTTEQAAPAEVPPPVPEPTEKPRRRRTGLLVAAAVLALGAVAFFFVTRDGSPTGDASPASQAAGSAEVLYEDPLDGSVTEWPGGSSDCVASLTPDGYELIAAVGVARCGGATFFEPELASLANVRVEVTTMWVVADGTPVDPEQGIGLAGPRCRTARRAAPVPNDGYLFAVSPTGYYRVVKAFEGEDTVLAEGKTDALAPALGTPRRAAIECVEDGESLLIRLFNDETLVDEVRDAEPLPPASAGFSLRNLTDAPLTARFTDLVVSVPEGD
ncbi:MAG: toll/interleukin-1 receptor domain-containing protein [Actinomycetota bacterium]|nr:toll/interleukin-1 receptor domain-containing protein [Actinomycetota bacterium]